NSRAAQLSPPALVGPVIHSSSLRLPSSPCLAPSNQEPGNPPLQGSPAAPCHSLRPTLLLIQTRPPIPEAAAARCPRAGTVSLRAEPCSQKSTQPRFGGAVFMMDAARDSKDRARRKKSFPAAGFQDSPRRRSAVM